MIDSVMEKIRREMLIGRDAEANERYLKTIEEMVFPPDQYVVLADELYGLAPGKTIQCIKMFRFVAKCGLKEAKDAIDAARDRRIATHGDEQKKQAALDAAQQTLHNKAIAIATLVENYMAEIDHHMAKSTVKAQNAARFLRASLQEYGEASKEYVNAFSGRVNAFSGRF